MNSIDKEVLGETLKKVAPPKIYNNEMVLRKAVIDKSEGDTWEEARKEWCIKNPIEDIKIAKETYLSTHLYAEPTKVNTTCSCGKEKLVYLYKITNKNNGKILFPIGSTCIRYFLDEGITRAMEKIKSFIKIIDCFLEESIISVDSGIYNKNNLLYIYENGGFLSYKDYTFMKEVRYKNNQKDQDDLLKSDNIIKTQIVPFLNKILGTNKEAVIEVRPQKSIIRNLQQMSNFITEEGIQKVVVVNAEDKISKKGNKMTVITFENSKSKIGKLYLTKTPNNLNIINDKLEKMGLNPETNIKNKDFIGKIFKVKGEYKLVKKTTLLGTLVKVKSDFMSFEVL